ncbi:hypothetical protein K470DRAFT_242165 [Piedraia hortae CBS 480.64]|uniref:WD40 repeat-like protein n=1 Tax=Piedraia hortae CBS 480.64 TaxID=1314780 RepID=A0A6A7C5L5_9PEZI|nr:hypothetical protein K470DRAFT_242165 [Piedraia hortae CBS 480.64]
MATRCDGAHATPSPCGRLVACLPAAHRVRVCLTSSTCEASEYTTKLPLREVSALRWSPEATLLAIVGGNLVEVIDIDDSHHRIRLDNGSGRLGAIRSAEFVAEESLLTVWEFGRAMIWDLITGKGTELGDLKTPTSYALREGKTLAAILRHDVLNVWDLKGNCIATGKVSGDPQGLSYCPGGRWIAVTCPQYCETSLQIFSGDGHRYKGISNDEGSKRHAIGVKEILWAPDWRFIVLVQGGDGVAMLNTRTFAVEAVFDAEHGLESEGVKVFQETISSSGQRSYASVSKPFMPPRLEAVAKTGVVGFSADGAYLSFRPPEMASSIFIFDVDSRTMQSVIIQHSAIKRMTWHPNPAAALLMIDCGEGVAHLYNAKAPHETPRTVNVTDEAVTANLAWVDNAIFCVSKSAFWVYQLEGQSHMPASATTMQDQEEDSLMDMLLAGKSEEKSYTERVDYEVNNGEDGSQMMDDTFRNMKQEEGKDPLDDSEIF